MKIKMWFTGAVLMDFRFKKLGVQGPADPRQGVFIVGWGRRRLPSLRKISSNLQFH